LRRGIHVIKDPEVAKLLADDTRRGMLHLLSHHEMSTTGLSKALDKSHSSIIHHLNLLREAGLIEETRTGKVRNIVQPYYRSVGKRFYVSYSLDESLADDEDYSAWQEAFLQRLVDGLKAFDILVPEEKGDRVRELLRTCYLHEKKAFEESLEQRTESSRLGRHANMSLVRILSQIRLSQDDEHKKAIEELLSLIRLNTNGVDTL
jgi:DNA-binding transcriptional ArsR family regulator